MQNSQGAACTRGGVSRMTHQEGTANGQVGDTEGDAVRAFPRTALRGAMCAGGCSGTAPGRPRFPPGGCAPLYFGWVREPGL